MFSAQFIQETKSFQKNLHTVLNSISSLFAFNSLIIRLIINLVYAQAVHSPSLICQNVCIRMPYFEL